MPLVHWMVVVAVAAGSSRRSNSESAIESPPGQIYFWYQRVLYLGPSVRASAHEHHAVQVFIPLSGTIRLRSGPESKWRRYGGAIVPSSQCHEADMPVELLATVWLEPDMEQARRLVDPRCKTPLQPIARSTLDDVVPLLAQCWEESYDAQRASLLVDEVLEILAPCRPSVAVVDQRVARARAIIGAMPEKRASVMQLADTVSLSPSRLTHLFTTSLHMPPRRYQLWLRLLDAVAELSLGASITEAAYAAGFADAPHLTRTFRRMLGFTPAAAKRAKFVRGADQGT